ncbi:hypothetical protein LZ30DRAFT_728594 [Colletotrichum cereale]|nr:hypothetical protein LZ30DRAFT_728594 [Colletotrichum cereale]
MRISTYTPIAALVIAAMAQQQCFFNGAPGFCDGNQDCKVQFSAPEPDCRGFVEGKFCATSLGPGACTGEEVCSTTLKAFDPSCPL